MIRTIYGPPEYPYTIYLGPRIPRKLKKRINTYYNRRIAKLWARIGDMIKKAKKPYPHSYAEAFPELYRYEHGEQNLEEYKKLLNPIK